MATMNISLPDAMKKWVEDQVATGRYANASDVVRDLIRRAESREAVLVELEEAVRIGLESGPPVPYDPDAIWEEALAKHAARKGKAVS